MKKTSSMRRLVGLGFALLVLTANLPTHGAMSMNNAQKDESQAREGRIKACGANEDLPVYEHNYALVIGQSSYKDWPQLPGAKQDVQEIEKILKEHGFVVTVLMDPTRLQFDKAISDFKSTHDQLNPSRFLLYFSGHGYTDKTAIGLELGYIVPSDAPLPRKDMGGFSAKAISMNAIETIAREISPCHALFVFDSCFSGSLFTTMRGVPEGITARTNEPVRLFITAGTETQQVPDDSLFRQAFVKGLQGAADRNGDKFVTGTELGEFLIDSVTKYSGGRQTPRYGKIRDPKLDQGDFVFVLPGYQNFQPFALDSKYFPSGWMGNVTGVDGTGTLVVSKQAVTIEGKPAAETRIEYKQGREKGWAGIYWQHPDKNWGDKPGLNLKGAKRISFYAKGERGGELVEFISGNNDSGKQHQDKFKLSIGPFPLTKTWTKYTIDLSQLKEQQLASVIGAFAWVASGGFDKDGRLVTYIADLRIE